MNTSECSSAYHLFLCPQKVLGRPVMMRIAPRTPNPGSILVSREMAVCAGELVLDAVALAVDVGTRVDVTFVGTTVVMRTVFPLGSPVLVVHLKIHYPFCRRQ